MMKKNNIDLVKYCKEQLGKPYWYGTFGQLSGYSLYISKKRQYPNYYTANDFGKQYGRKVHDCIGLIKGYIWSRKNSDENPVYQSNGCPDCNEVGMYDASKVKGGIETIPDVPGILVYKEGHIGVYIGNGYCIEARGHAYGVVKTKLSERGWTKWSYCPYIEYKNVEIKTESKLKKYKGPFPTLPKKGCLTIKDKGVNVKRLQQFLNWYGNYNLEIDGSFGPLTTKAVLDYQNKEGLQTDAKFGPMCLKVSKTIKR